MGLCGGRFFLLLFHFAFHLAFPAASLSESQEPDWLHVNRKSRAEPNKRDLDAGQRTDGNLDTAHTKSEPPPLVRIRTLIVLSSTEVFAGLNSAQLQLIHGAELQ